MIMQNRFKALACALLVVALFCPAGTFAAGPVMLNMDVPAGHWKSAKLDNLSKGAVLKIRIESNGAILVAVLDSQSFRGKPDTERPLFAGQVEKVLSFTVAVEQQGAHYILLDNRRGNEKREVRITLQSGKEGVTGQAKKGKHTLQEFGKRLHRIFIFDPFPITSGKCESKRPFSSSAGIIVCTEYIRHLNEGLKNEETASDFLHFSLFHEVGRRLLEEWTKPSAVSVEAADEMAAVLMVMLNQKARALRVARFAIRNPRQMEELRTPPGNERHPLSEERAKKVLQWIEKPETVQRWQKVLVPHMQTELLKALKRKPTLWTDLPLVEKELTKRKRTAV